MHRISLAPVLSATRSRDSCWITSISCMSAGSSAAVRPEPGGAVCCAADDAAGAASLGLFEDLHDPPALGGGQRPGLHEQHPVADAARVLLVVRLQLAGTAHHLAVQRVLDPVLDLDHDGLVHLVADDQALPDLAPPTRLRSLTLLTHEATSTGAAERPSSRSRMI